jgi:dihydrolipoamide dehydrogenase
MKEYEIIVIGSGSGANIVQQATDKDLKVALVDKGPTGGTCLNLGCIPSKLLIAAADRAMDIREAGRFGIETEIGDIDFTGIMDYMKEYIQPLRREQRKNLQEDDRVDFYDGPAEFTGECILQTSTEAITAEKIFIAAGARPLVPDIEGFEDIDYLDNESVLELTDLPKSMVIVGGGYIACEYGHFFSSLGTDVTIMQMENTLLSKEDEDVSQLLTSELSKRMTVRLNTTVVKAEESEKGCRVIGENGQSDDEVVVEADRVMLAAGRTPNSDTLEVGRTKVETDDQGFIITDEYLETKKGGIWATGDINGKGMFTHVANREARVAWHNSMSGHKTAFDYSAVPHAVFTRPRIAAVGMTQKRAAKEHDILVGTARYTDVVKGSALRHGEGFAKAIVDKNDWKILGFHIVGHAAPMIIQEVINAMAAGGDVDLVTGGMHIHPAGSELVMSAFGKLREP